MRILVLNSGSSSIKFSLFATAGTIGSADDGPPLQTLLDGEATGLGTPAAALAVRNNGSGAGRSGGASLKPGDGADAASAAIARLFHRDAAPTGDAPGTPVGVDAIGYRVVHPGPRIHEHCRLTPDVLEELKAATIFAPLHQPPVLRLIEALGRELPGVPAFCCFDTVFHETMPEEARTYALPAAVRAKGVRRYGFHGLSCEGVVRRLHDRAAAGGTRGRPFPQRLIVAHLGSGCSVTAVRDGASLENTMGLTPDGGVVMGTRPGDLDPGVVLFLLRDAGKEQTADAVAAVEAMLNQASGTAAVADMANDMKAIREAARGGNDEAALSVRVFTRSVRKAIGSYAALLGGVDTLVFTGGIGEHDETSRREILDGLDAFGLRLATEAGGVAEPGSKHDGAVVQRISPEDAPAEVLVVQAEEDRMIAMHVAEMMETETENSGEKRPAAGDHRQIDSP